METLTLSHGAAGAGAPATYSVLQTVIIADKYVHWLLFMIGSLPNNVDPLSSLLESENRFPFSDLNKVSTPEAECKDNSETEDDSDDDEDDTAGDDSDDDDAEDSSGEDDDDDEQGGLSSDSDANDDEDDDDDDEDDEDDDDDEEDDDDDDEEEDNQPPYKKTK